MVELAELEGFIKKITAFEESRAKRIFFNKFIAEYPNKTEIARIVLYDHQHLLNFERYPASAAVVRSLEFEVFPEDYTEYRLVLEQAEFLKSFAPNYQEHYRSLAERVRGYLSTRTETETSLGSSIELMLSVMYTNPDDYLDFVRKWIKANQSADQIICFQTKMRLEKGISVPAEFHQFYKDFFEIQTVRSQYQDSLLQYLTSSSVEDLIEHSEEVREAALDCTRKGLAAIEDYCKSREYEVSERIALQAIHLFTSGLELEQQPYTIDEMLDGIITRPTYGKELLQKIDLAGKTEVVDQLFKMAFDRTYAAKMQTIYHNKIKPILNRDQN